MRRIAILGAGRIGEALLSGLVSSGSTNIVATSRSEARVTELRERYGVDATTANDEAVQGADVVVLAVKPQDIDALLAEIHDALTPGQTVLTVAAAITTRHIEERLPDGTPVVRAMPNAPSVVHEGMAGLAPGSHAGDADVELAGEILTHLRRGVRVPESAMDAVTPPFRSGPPA